MAYAEGVLTERAKHFLKFAGFLALAGAVTYYLFRTPAGALFLSTAGRKELVGQLDFFVRSTGLLGPVVFTAIYALGSLVFPVTPFTAAGALIFGKFLGAICNILGAICGASLSFLMGRYLLRGFAQGFLRGRLAHLDRKVEEHGFSVIFYMRVFWFPFIVLNYAAGATRIRFADFFWGTLFGILPALVIVSFFFGNLREIAASYRGPADLLQPDILIPAFLLALTFFLPSLHKRVKKRRSKGEPPEDDI